MINTEKTTNTVKLQIFNFDLPHFVENHLDTATSDVHELRSKLPNNGKLPCRMGFIVADKLHQYQDDLNNAHFRIGSLLDYQSNCLAMKPKYTYHVNEQMSDRDIALMLLSSYINWLNRQIKQVQGYAKKLVFSKLIINVVPKRVFPSEIGEVRRYRVDSVYTRKSLLDLISQNITDFYKQMLNNNDIAYYNSRYYLDWLLTDKHLREHFMLKMLSLPDLKQLVQNNSNLVETILQVCQFNFDDMEDNLLSKGKKLASIAATFATVILPMLEPITETLPKSYEHAMYNNNWETYNYDNLKLLARLENYFHKAYFTFPVSFINDLAYYETGYLSMLHLQLLNGEDLNYLLNNGFKTSVTFETMQDTLEYNDDFTSRITNMLNRSVIDLNGNRQLILNWLSKLKHKSKKHNLTNIEYNQMDILRCLLK